MMGDGAIVPSIDVSVIPNLDLLFQDGYMLGFGDPSRPKTTLLIYGPAGAGKTNCLLSMARGAAVQGRASIFITFAHRANALNEQVRKYNWLDIDSERGCPWDFVTLSQGDPKYVRELLHERAVASEKRRGIVVTWAIDEETHYDIERFKTLCERTIKLFRDQRDLAVIAVDGVNRLRFDSVANQLSETGPALDTCRSCDALGTVGLGPGRISHPTTLSMKLSYVMKLQDLGVLLCMSAETTNGANADPLRDRILEETKYQANVVIELGKGFEGNANKRYISLRKARAQGIVDGRHELEMSPHGVQVMPNPESWEKWPGWHFADQFMPALSNTIKHVGLIPDDQDISPWNGTARLEPIKRGQSSLLRGPAATHKHNFAITFIEHGNNGWLFDLGWSNYQVTNSRFSLDGAPEFVATRSPSQLFHGIAGAARTYMRKWIKEHYDSGSVPSPRAVIADVGLLERSGLPKPDIYRYVESMTGLLSKLGYSVLVVENVDQEGDYFLDPVFDNVYVTQLRSHKPSGKQCPWLHARRQGGHTSELFDYYRITAPDDDKGYFRLDVDQSVAHIETSVVIPELTIRLYHETQPQRAHIAQVTRFLGEQSGLEELEPHVIDFSPETADAVYRGFLSHRYDEHLNQCLVAAFDEAWIQKLLPYTKKSKAAFIPLWSSSEQATQIYPDKALERVTRNVDGKSMLHALPFYLNVSLMPIDLDFLRRGLRTEIRRFDSLLKDKAHFWRRLLKSVKPEESDMHSFLSVARHRLRLSDWALAARCSYASLSSPQHGAQSEQREGSPAEWPLFSIKRLRDETLICFMLGYLMPWLPGINVSPSAKGARRPIKNTHPTDDDLSDLDKIRVRLEELHYVFCLTGLRVGNERQESLSDWSPITFEWYTTYRADFDSKDRPRNLLYCLAEPSDFLFFTGDWYLGVRSGSQAQDRGKDVIEYPSRRSLSPKPDTHTRRGNSASERC